MALTFLFPVVDIDSGWHQRGVHPTRKWNTKVLSSNAIKKLGKRLRNGTATADDFDLLDAYRGEFEPLLLQTCQDIGGILSDQVRYIVAGRMKRTKSIIRKLARDANAGMDLSRMSDLVGLRVIVNDYSDQEQVVGLLSKGLKITREPYDYRDRSAGYRAVHLIVGNDAHRVEVQVRTLPQHLWADESERLGEQVKEGTMPPEIERRLQDLHQFCVAKDCGGNVGHEPSWEATLQLQSRRFSAVAAQQLSRESRSYVVVYHQLTNALIRVEPFSQNERAEAISFFKYVSRTYDGPDYDILVLNSPSQNALVVTHPRYFPEGMGDPSGRFT